jgi:hypothetical protein
MTRVIVIAIIILALSAIGIMAQTDKPPLDIPVYPGAETAMEVNLTNEDILPTLQALLPLMGNKLGPMGETLQPEGVADLLKDLKRLQLLQLNILKASVSEADVTHFYEKNLPSGKWSRVYYQSKPASGTIALYAQNAMEAIYGFRVTKSKIDGKPAKRVEVLKTDGAIDLIKVISFVGKLFESTASQSSVSGSAGVSD